MPQPSMKAPVPGNNSQPQWGNSAPVADPNNNFIMKALTGTNTPGYNPNTDNSVGVPITNTPSTNTQNVPYYNMIRSAFNNSPRATNGQ